MSRIFQLIVQLIFARILRACRHEIPSHNARQRICTIARKDDDLFA